MPYKSTNFLFSAFTFTILSLINLEYPYIRTTFINDLKESNSNAGSGESIFAKIAFIDMDIVANIKNSLNLD
jgi:hypothetical protein